jgi:hypothetical protein
MDAGIDIAGELVDTKSGLTTPFIKKDMFQGGDH